MPSSLSHAIAGIAVASPLAARDVPKRYWALAALAAVIVDADYLWSGGLSRGHWLAHRGLTHAPVFAAALAGVLVWLGFRGAAWRGQRRRLWLGLTLATTSHGVLDAMATRAMGITFLLPLSTERYVMRWQPLTSVRHAWSTQPPAVVQALLGEMLWIWIPSAVLLLVLWRRRTAGPQRTDIVS